MQSGVMFCICNAAITVYGSTLAASLNQPADALISEWKRSLIPGIQLMPSGVWALDRTHEKGCGNVFAG